MRVSLACARIILGESAESATLTRPTSSLMRAECNGRYLQESTRECGEERDSCESKYIDIRRIAYLRDAVLKETDG